jgi:hypothetical protein
MEPEGMMRILQSLPLLACLIGCESLRSTTSTALPEPSAVAAAAPSPQARRPAKHWLRVGPYVIHSETALDAADPLFRDLARLPDQIAVELELPPGDALVQVFLFDSADRYDDYMRLKYPKLPKRRAYFFAERGTAGGDDLIVYTWPSEHLAKDLRHELTHATLHGILKGVPLWLDEGFAGYFELPPASRGINSTHLETLRRGPFLPDLARLERLGQVAQMETPEYREAWGWVHYLLTTSDAAAKQVLLTYLKELRTNPTPGPLQPRLCEVLADPNRAFLDHLANIDESTAASHR